MSHYGLMEVPANGPTSPRRRFVQVYSDFLRDRSLSSDARFLGTLFASFVGREGLAFPGTRQLMLLTGWGRHRITRARSELTRNERMTKVFEQGKGGRFQGVKYRVGDAILHRRPFAQVPGKR